MENLCEMLMHTTATARADYIERRAKDLFYGHDDAVDELIRHGCDSPENKALVDQLVYAFAQIFGKIADEKGYFSKCSHAGTDGDDVAIILFVDYRGMNFQKLTTMAQPGHYIKRSFKNRVRAIYASENSILNVREKATSTRRKLYYKAMRGNLPKEEFEALTPAVKVWLTQTMAANDGCEYLDSDTPVAISDDNSDNDYRAYEHANSMNAAVYQIFEDPILREIFTLMYYWRYDESITRTDRTKHAYAVMSEKYGMTASEFNTYAGKVRKIVEANADSIIKMLGGQCKASDVTITSVHEEKPREDVVFKPDYMTVLDVSSEKELNDLLPKLFPNPVEREIFSAIYCYTISKHIALNTRLHDGTQKLKDMYGFTSEELKYWRRDINLKLDHYNAGYGCMPAAC